jgi:hypothetical protein
MSRRSTPRLITLVAMAPSGETFIARDADGVVRLYAPARPAHAVDGETVERALLAGFNRVEMCFASWPELDAERQRRAGLIRRDVRADLTTWDAARTRRAFSQLASWIVAGRVTSARRVLQELLHAPVVMQEHTLVEEIAELLDRCSEYETVRVPVDAPDERHAVARARMHLSPA